MGLLKNLFKKSDPAPIKAEPPKPDPQLTLHIPEEIKACRIAYKYEGVDVAGVEFANPDFAQVHLCDKLKFEPEPDNKADPKAIKIMVGDMPIGYVHKGKLQGMIADWLKRSDPMFAAITGFAAGQKQIQYFIAFYRDPLYGVENYDSISAALTKTSKKDEFEGSRQDNFDTLSERDILQLDYNSYDEDYVVSDEYGNELGELSKSISEKLHEREDAFDFVAVVDEVTENDSGKYGAKITVYFKPER